MSFNDGLWPLPQSWSWSPTAEIGDVSLGRQRSPENHSGPNMRPYVRSANITWSGWDLSDVKKMNFDEADFATFQLRAGDVLLNEGSGSAAEVGKPAVWEGQIASCCFQNTLLCFRSDQVDPWYARAFFSFSAKAGHLVKHTQGVNIFHIGKRGLEQLALPVAPPSEQRRIVAKIDRLSARSKRAREELGRTNSLMKRYKQAVLSECLAEAAASSPRVAFEDLLSVLTSGSRDWAQYYDRGSSVFVLAGNVRPLAFDATPKRFVDPPLEGPDARRSKIRKNDLLLTIVGAGTGDICHVPDDFKNYFVCQSVALARLKEPETAKFYAYWFNSEACGRGDFEEAMYGAARPHLSFEQIRSFVVPAVSPTTADEIIRRIEQAFAAIDRLAAEATSAQNLLDRLDQAVLAKAFRGELVPQDPNDEPASALLERIRAERATAPAPKRGRRPKAAR